MKTYTRIQRFACGLLVTAVATGAFAQEADQPPADPAEATAAESAEDVPPPEPIPAPAPVPRPAPAPNTFVSEDSLVRAYDFGVSMLPGGNGGVTIRGVIVGSAAERAGVKPMDTIVAINGTPVGSPQEVVQTQVQSVTINRRGTQQTLRVDAAPTRVQAAPPAAAPAARSYSYSVPRTTYSAPQRYTYRTPSSAYRAIPYGADYGRYYGYDSYRYVRPNVSVGIGIGSRGYPGYYGYGPGFGYGRGYYGRPGGYYGPGFYGGGRSGVGIRIGGFGISF